MEDRFGHHISYLRVSVTDRCNERCRYCLPDEEQEWLPRDDVLSYEEMLRVIRVGAGMGIRKVRVTGGEPLTRRNVLWFFEELGKIEGIDDIGISTNGTLLARPANKNESITVADALRRSGVRTVNVSLDTLDPATYQKTTGRDWLDRAIEGIDAARAAGFGEDQLKINSVLMKNDNEHELWPLIEFARERELLLRFIELMPVSSREMLTEENFLSAGEAKKLIEFKYGALTAEPEFRTNGPASYYRLGDSEQKIGFIGAMTNLHFCETCNKLRLTCDGKLRPCLGSHLEFDMREVLRDEKCDDSDVAKFFTEVVHRKPEAHDFRENYQPGRRMVAIGG
jgi:cyclic pyranopterin phosphate synthase